MFFSFYSNPLLANSIASSTNKSTAGYFQLSWNAENATSYLVEQSQDASFDSAVTVYQGSDVKTVISGMPNGHYFYRMQANGRNWTEAVKVEVKHHSLQRALGFFMTGAVMLCILLIVLIKGYKHAQD